MRWTVGCLAAFVLGGCALDPFVTIGGETYSSYAGNWLIENNIDPITGIAVPSARVFTIRSSSASLEYFAKPASMQLTCSDRDPVVKFSYDFKVGSSPNSIFGYRFDERPGQDNVNVRFLHNAKAIVIEDRATVVQFIKNMEGTRRLVVRSRSFNAGRSVTEFDVNGSEAAIKAAFASCPLEPKLTRSTS